MCWGWRSPLRTASMIEYPPTSVAAGISSSSRYNSVPGSTGVSVSIVFRKPEEASRPTKAVRSSEGLASIDVTSGPCANSTLTWTIESAATDGAWSKSVSRSRP